MKAKKKEPNKNQNSGNSKQMSEEAAGTLSEALKTNTSRTSFAVLFVEDVEQ